MSYILGKKAEEDVIAIYLEGAALFGIRQADRYHLELEKRLQFLSEHPEAAQQRFELKPPVRIHPFQSHIIIYTIIDNGDVFIIRIRHGREDWLE